MKNRKVVKLDESNIQKHFFDQAGNIYFRYPNHTEFELLVDFDINDCLIGLSNKIEFIFISE